tara:strand:+ start:565 stop:717 length:153 start_codon:yes stop_codon:yes gene_type:complete
MPYTIRKLPNKNLYRVRVKRTGKIIAKATTLKKAKAQIRYLNYMEGKKKK